MGDGKSIAVFGASSLNVKNRITFCGDFVKNFRLPWSKSLTIHHIIELLPLSCAWNGKIAKLMQIFIYLSTDIPADDILELFGKTFFEFCQDSGYDKILQVLGATPRDFLQVSSRYLKLLLESILNERLICKNWNFYPLRHFQFRYIHVLLLHEAFSIRLSLRFKFKISISLKIQQSS